MMVALIIAAAMGVGEAAFRIEFHEPANQFIVVYSKPVKMDDNVRLFERFLRRQAELEINRLLVDTQLPAAELNKIHASIGMSEPARLFKRISRSTFKKAAQAHGYASRLNSQLEKFVLTPESLPGKVFSKAIRRTEITESNILIHSLSPLRGFLVDEMHVGESEAARICNDMRSRSKHPLTFHCSIFKQLEILTNFEIADGLQEQLSRAIIEVTEDSKREHLKRRLLALTYIQANNLEGPAQISFW